MNEQTKQTPIENIIIDEEIYPRKQGVWLVAYQYSQAMKAGAIFPPIVIGEYKKKLYLIDGRHRMNAHKLLEHTTVETIVKKYTDRKAMFIDSIKLNNIHGKALTVSDKTKIYGTLKNWKISEAEISSLLNTPIDNLKIFEERLLPIGGKEETIRSVIVNQLKTGRISEQEATTIAKNENQNKFVNRTALQALNNCVGLFENNLVPLDEIDVKDLTVKLLSLIQSALKAVEVTAA